MMIANYREKLGATLLAILAGLVVGALVMWQLKKPEQKVNETVIATKAPEIKLEPTVSTPVKVVKTYKSKIKKKLKLPKEVIDNEHKLVIASNKVQADDHPHTITSTINTQTGEVETFDRKDPLPWIAFNQRTEVTAAYGYKYSRTQQGMVGRFGARHEFIQSKNMGLGITGSVDTDGSAFAGLELRIRF